MFALKVLLFLIGFIAVERFCHRQTNGFMLHKIQSDLPFDANREVAPLPEKEHQEVMQRLDQTYHYLKCGGQFFAFISEDGTTIIKFLKLHHMRQVDFLKSLHLPKMIDISQIKIMRYKARRFHSIFNSCKIAYEHFKDETGLLYSHLNKTDDLHKIITIRDKLGIYHKVDLDKTEFLVQKRAVLASSKFQDIMNRGDTENAKKCIDSMVDLFIHRYHKGIQDKDPVIRRNFGYIEDTAIEIDLGSYFLDESIKNPENYKARLVEEMVNFQKWLSIHYPAFTPYLEEKISKELDKN